MNTDYLMAIDAGTGGSRCLIFDTEGRLITKQYSEWNFNSREDIGFMAKDLNPKEFWNSIISSIKKAIVDPKIDSSKIRGISTTSYREGFFLLDENGKELYAAPADDMRAISQGMNILGKYGDKLYNISGRIPPMLFASAKITWFKEKEPEIYNKIRTLLMMNDWIVYKLTGLYSSEPSAACETELFDIKQRKWSKELINLLELPEDIYPPIYDAGTEIGPITNEVSELTGLEKETPVVVGGADSECCLLGMGLINNGETGIIAGTTTPIQMVLDKPILPSKKLWTNCHLIPNKWNLESNAGPSGKLIRWLRDTLAIREKDIAMKSDKTAFALMDEIIEKVPLGSNNSYSFLGPMVCDWSNLKPLGMGGFLLPLPIDTDTAFAKGMILRSYFENMAYVLKLNINQLADLSGLEVNKAFISGGLANSNVYNEIVTNVLNIPVYTFGVTETTGLGAAICASIGTDLFDDFKESIASMVRIKEVLKPDKNKARIYRKGLRKWSKYKKILSKMS